MQSHIKLYLYSLVIILTLTSVLSLYSISLNSPQKYSSILSKQIMWISIGSGLALIISRLPYTKIIRGGLAAYIVISAALIYLPLFGQSIRGSRCWISFGNISLQPAEFIKIAMIMLFASTFKYPMSNIRRLLYFSIISIPPMILIALQPDLGIASLLTAFYTVCIFTTIIKKTSHVLIILLLFACLGVITTQFLARERHINRIKLFLEGKNSPNNMQQNNAVALIGYGGFAGRGFGNISVYKPLYVPDRHNDFLYSCIGEQFGFIGSALIAIVFYSLVFLLFSSAEIVKDTVAGKIIYFSAIYLCIQGTINLFVNLGMLPVTGLNMPFLGYGGSSTLSWFILLGVILSITRKPLYSFHTS